MYNYSKPYLYSPLGEVPVIDQGETGAGTGTEGLGDRDPGTSAAGMLFVAV